MKNASQRQWSELDRPGPDGVAAIGAERTTARVVDIIDRCLNRLDWAVEFCERCDQAFTLSDLGALIAARDRLAAELAAKSH